MDTKIIVRINTNGKSKALQNQLIHKTIHGVFSISILYEDILQVYFYEKPLNLQNGMKDKYRNPKSFICKLTYDMSRKKYIGIILGSSYNETWVDSGSNGEWLVGKCVIHQWASVSGIISWTIKNSNNDLIEIKGIFENNYIFPETINRFYLENYKISPSTNRITLHINNPLNNSLATRSYFLAYSFSPDAHITQLTLVEDKQTKINFFNYRNHEKDISITFSNSKSSLKYFFVRELLGENLYLFPDELKNALKSSTITYKRCKWDYGSIELRIELLLKEKGLSLLLEGILPAIHYPRF